MLCQQSCLTIPIGWFDIIMVPCIAVDREGNRLGRGGGFYDRFLSCADSLIIICLAYGFQLVDKIVPEKHDQKVDIIVTEKRILNVRAKNV